MNHLCARHPSNSKKESVSSIIASLVGTGIHDQLQRFLKIESTLNNNWLIERKLVTLIDGVRVAGKFDALYNREILYDIKVSKAYKLLKGDLSEWEQQLNAYDYMLWKDGIHIKDLKVFMVVSDWNKMDTFQTNYPDTNITIIPINRWERTIQESWMKTRIELWKSSSHLSDQDLPLCTSKERWANDSIYKLYRTSTLKKATKTFTSQTKATNYLNVCKRKDESKWEDAIIRVEVGSPWRRCDPWCDARDFCNQFQNKLEV